MPARRATIARPPFLRAAGPAVLTFLVSAAGALLFGAMGLPLPWLLGPLAACLAAALSGLTLGGAPRLVLLTRTILGVAVGAAVTPALFARLPALAPSLALIPVLILVIGAVGYPYFRRVFGFDHPTAFYAAMPGGLQDMLIFGEEAGGDLRALSLIHATRVTIIVTVLPVLFATLLDIDFTRPPGESVGAIPPIELLLMGVIALVGWKGAEAVGLFGASILGPMFLAAAASLTGVISHRPPAEAIYAAQFAIGFTVGLAYVGVTWRELSRDVAAGVGYTLLIFAVSMGFAGAVVLLGLMPLVEGTLAFSPGGQAEMAILALVAGADVAIVVAHHIVRVVVILLCAPLVGRWRGRA